MTVQTEMREQSASAITESLLHQCPTHPWADGPPCIPGVCRAWCGHKFDLETVEGRNYVTPRDCVVCEELAA